MGCQEWRFGILECLPSYRYAPLLPILGVNWQSSKSAICCPFKYQNENITRKSRYISYNWCENGGENFGQALYYLLLYNRTISRWIFGGKMRVHRPNNSSVPANTAITYPFYLFSLPFFSLNNSIEEIDLPIEFDLSSK